MEKLEIPMELYKPVSTDNVCGSCLLCVNRFGCLDKGHCRFRGTGKVWRKVKNPPKSESKESPSSTPSAEQQTHDAITLCVQATLLYKAGEELSGDRWKYLIGEMEKIA